MRHLILTLKKVMILFFLLPQAKTYICTFTMNNNLLSAGKSQVMNCFLFEALNPFFSTHTSSL